MNTTFNFSGKVALVTGGVSGIGAAASLAFKRAGASVIACGVTERLKASDAAAPIPETPPVTRATLPLKLKVVFMEPILRKLRYFCHDH